MEFGKLACGIWKKISAEHCVPYYWTGGASESPSAASRAQTQPQMHFVEFLAAKTLLVATIFTTLVYERGANIVANTFQKTFLIKAGKKVQGQNVTWVQRHFPTAPAESEIQYIDKDKCIPFCQCGHRWVA